MMDFIISWIVNLCRGVPYYLNRLSLQFRIVSALAERELLQRTEKGALGALGVLLEPLLVVMSLLALRLLIRFRAVDLINPVIWMVSGVTIFYLFLAVGIKALDGIKKSQEIFFYRRIRPLDTLLATALVESRIYATTLVLIICLVAAWTWQLRFDDPGLAVLAFVLTVILALGVGVSALVIGRRIPLVKLLVRFGIRRLLLWTSGIFYSIYTIPAPARYFLTWNPVLHAVELFRHAINQAYPIPDISVHYLAACALISCGFGLLFYSTNENLLLAED